jgi:hypothetical protein
MWIYTDRQTGRQNSGFTHIHNTYSYRLQLHSTGGRIIAVHTVTESPCIFYVYNYKLKKWMFLMEKSEEGKRVIR